MPSRQSRSWRRSSARGERGDRLEPPVRSRVANTGERSRICSACVNSPALMTRWPSHAGCKTVSAREDRLLKPSAAVLRAAHLGPMRLERLEKQLKTQARSDRKNGKLAGARIRKQIAEADRKIKAQIVRSRRGSSQSSSPSGSLSFAGTKRHSRTHSARLGPSVRRKTESSPSSWSESPT
jgi:hypothetical protein